VIDALRRLVARLRPDGSLTVRTVRSAIWSAGVKVGGRVLQLLTVVILARILGPEAFGLLGIALVTRQGLERFTRPGIDRALVHRREADVDDYLDTAFAIQVVRGITIAGILYVSAPFVAAFFSEPRVTPILQAFALLPLLTGLTNPSIVYFEKDLAIDKKFAFEMTGAVAQFAVAVGVGVVYQTVWALVFGYLAAGLGKLVASYLLHPYRPGLGARLGQARELFGYGKWITASSAVSYLLVSGDDAVVGYVLSTAALGFYQLGYQFGKIPMVEAASTLSTVVFPLYAKLQDDAEALSEALCRTLRLLSFVAFPAAVGIVLTAQPFVLGVLGPEWEPVIPVMQIAAVYGAFAALSSVFNDVWNAIGRPDYNTKINLVRLVVTAVIIYPATVTYGIVGTVGAVAGVFLVLIVPIKLYVAVRSVETDFRRIARELAYPTVASGLMALVLLGVRPAVDALPPVAVFVVLVVVGVVAYAGAVYLVESRSAWGIRADFQTVVGAIR
jgi:PST family polysaccharide transporter/lipopolysaccharide exporter